MTARSLRLRPSPALVVALIALAISVGGTAFAAVKITSGNIVDGTVQGRDVKDRTLTGIDVANGSLQAADLAAAARAQLRGADGATGPQGPQGVPGPAGATGSSGLLPGPAPVEPPPVDVPASGAPVPLATTTFTASGARRILVAGGFDANCNPCSGPLQPQWRLDVDGSVIVQRVVSTVAAAEKAGAAVSEILTTPPGCAPCVVKLSLVVPVAGGDALSATGIRLAVADLGPVG